MTTKISTADARKNFSDIVNKVSYGSEQIILTRRGQEVAAIVSTDSLKLLQKIEDTIDIEDAMKALSEGGNNLSSQEVWKQLGLQNMTYSIEFRPSVLKSLKRLPKQDLVKIKNKIDSLSKNLPDPTTTKLKGNNPFHRIRAGNYRIIYEINNNQLIVLVVKIGHKKDIYKRLT